MPNVVYIAISLDGFIADKQGKLDWLNTVPNPNENDFGYSKFVDSIDAIVMGRVTFETVLGFGIEWPYKKTVFVLSNTLKKVPEELIEKVQIVNGPLKTVLKNLNQKSFNNLYIDGGSTIQSFLQEGLIDEMVITTIPILLGGGVPLFGDLPNHIQLELKNSKVFLGSIVQNNYIIKN